MIAELTLNTISKDPELILHQLGENLNSYTSLTKPESFLDKSIHAFIQKRDSFTHIGNIYFFTTGFYPIFFEVKENIIEIESEVGQYYFPSSLKKVFFEAGGQVLGPNGEINPDWKPPADWKKLRHWGQYNWLNRPRK